MLIRCLLILATASFLVTGCMDAGPDDSLDEVTAALSSQCIDVDDPYSVPQVVRDMLIDMAAEESCPVGGLMLGKWSPDPDAEVPGTSLPEVQGYWGVNAFNLSLQPIGTADGIYGGGLGDALFEGFGGGNQGFIKAEYDSVTQHRGEIDGSWGLLNGPAGGTVRGVYYKPCNQGVAFWTRCQ